MLWHICKLLAVFVFLALFTNSAHAHEVNPSYFQLDEIAHSQFEVTWKQPLKDGKRLKLRPIFPDDCTANTARISQAGSAVIERWTLNCSTPPQSIKFEGLDKSFTDVFANITPLGGEAWTTVVRSIDPHLQLNAPQQSLPLWSYIRIGVEHILTGFDHLLFVLGLCLLVRARDIFWTLTSFTLAHSITLIMSTLGGWSLPGPPIEAVIALSLVFLAREALVLKSDKASLMREKPWLVAFGFGLLHGFGFAGALKDIGLPEGVEVWALALFNVGVELGQIIFVCALCICAWLCWKAVPRIKPHSLIWAAYIIGVAGMFWTVDRVMSFWV